ncbi:MAG: TonB-dependent receptor [Longimicrobiales bacterium]
MRLEFLAALGLGFLMSAPVQAQVRMAGRVVESESGAPVAGAVVYVSGGTVHTLSGPLGSFALQVRALPARLIAARLGLKPDTLFITSVQPIEFRLAPAALAMEPILIATERTFSVASSSVVRDLDIRLRPRDSSQRLLSLTPGLVIAQHAGGGKAEQIFLRGFDADHGTDIAISVDGIPVNMVSHAHGQGYADLHFLLPEVVERVETRKGAYDVRDGDFATAGVVQFRTRDRIDAPALSVRTGSFGARQVMAMVPLGLPTGSGGYVAGSWQQANGPFQATQNHRRANLFGKWTAPLRAGLASLSISGMDAQWNASGQVPQRAIASGQITRFGAIDPTEGGNTSRYDVRAHVRSRDDRAVRWEAMAFATRYRFQLFSNFTFALNDSINGDGIEQVDRRAMLGARMELSAEDSLLGRPGIWSTGTTVRHDAMAVALHNQSARVRRDTRTDDRIGQTHLAGWLKRDVQISQATRIQLGVRGDAFRFDVTDSLEDTDNGLPHGSGLRWSGLVSPRAGLATALDESTTLFASGGLGFHSNDARDVVRGPEGARVLPRALSAELGLRRSWKAGSLGLAAWLTDLQSELVFVGDEGSTEASGATRRVGIDAEARLRLLPWLWADADLNLSRGRFRAVPDGQDAIPLAPTLTSTGGLQAGGSGPLSSGVRYRLIGGRAADEANTVRARQSHVWEAFAGWERGRLRLNLAVDNLFDVAWNEAQFATTSRLRGELEPVTELHFTPGAPRSFILGAEVRF